MDKIKLTEFSHGAGCGCKISPAQLETILKGAKTGLGSFPNLLVGNDSKDDAAVLDMGNGQALISTTDFFMPIVDDGFDFGRIASVNAISDVYAMGGKPILAIAILGWPISKIPLEIASQVIEGARSICAEVGIPLAGGHSIDSPEPIFGLAVNGMVPLHQIKRNNQAKPDSLLYLTKSLGVGILSTAMKKGILKDLDFKFMLDSMTQLNRLGEKLGELSYVNALTDITGFGLLGHLLELCEGSGVHAEIDFNSIPLLPNLSYYLDLASYPGGTSRNWDSYGSKINPISNHQKYILADPQTSGGLLISIDEVEKENFENFLKSEGFSNLAPIGKLVSPNNAFPIIVEGS